MIKMKEKYIKEALPDLKEKFGYKNDLTAPRIVKAVVNVGFSPATGGEKIQEELSNGLAIITGQKPNPCQVKKPEAAFKTRKGMINGLKVTLRGKYMYDFLERLVNLALPRSRDFHGLPESNIDQAGNLNIGIKEHIIFPEILAENVKRIFSFQITVTTTARSKEEGMELFRLLGFPIKNKEQKTVDKKTINK